MDLNDILLSFMDFIALIVFVRKVLIQTHRLRKTRLWTLTKKLITYSVNTLPTELHSGLCMSTPINILLIEEVLAVNELKVLLNVLNIYCCLE